MTLDETIAKAKADGDVQIAEWLRQARGADAAARWYTKKLRDAHRTIRKILDENAKLREVAGIVAYCMQAERGCDGCKVNGAAGEVTEPAGCDVLLDLLRELGVVADGQA